MCNDVLQKKKNPMAKIYIQSFGEEVGNAISHGVMSIATLIALPFAAVWAYVSSGGQVQTAVGVSIFCLSIFMMFLISTLYHSMSPDSKHKDVFHILDHIFIYVAIAGSYTPIALDIIGGWQGIVIFVVQWVAVIFGIFYKSLSRKSIPALSLSIYLVMGWTIVFFFPIFLRHSSAIFISLIGLGGIFYTVGAVFYAMKGFKYHHLVWHLLINLAAASHFIAIVFFL